MANEMRVHAPSAEYSILYSCNQVDEDTILTGTNHHGQVLQEVVRIETVTTERVGMVVYILLTNRGRRYKTGFLAAEIGLQQHSVWEMLCKLSRVLPIVQEVDGWVIY